MLDDIILTIGKPTFRDALFESLRRAVRARQVVLFDFTADARVHSLAQKDDRADGAVHQLVRDYIAHHLVDDPFRTHYLPSATRSVEHHMFAAPEVARTGYAQKLFVEPGIAGKLSLIVRRPSGALCLTVYRDRGQGAFDTDDLDLLDRVKMPLAAAIERHAELLPDCAVPTLPGLDGIAHLLMSGTTMPRLSEREAQICARVVTGHSNEAIALVLDLSFHSVRTYRRRAYAKLGIASQNELFSLILHQGAPPRGRPPGFPVAHPGDLSPG